MSSKAINVEKYIVPGTKNSRPPRIIEKGFADVPKALDERLRNGWALKPFWEWLWSWGGKLIFTIIALAAIITIITLFAVNPIDDADLGSRILFSIMPSVFAVALVAVPAGCLRLFDTVKGRDLEYSSEGRPLMKQLGNASRAASSTELASSEARDALTRRVNRAMSDLTRVNDVEKDLYVDKYAKVPFTDKMIETLKAQVAESYARIRRELSEIEAEVAKIQADAATVKAMIEPSNDQVLRFAALQASLPGNTTAPAIGWSTVPGLPAAVAAMSLEVTPAPAPAPAPAPRRRRWPYLPQRFAA